MYTSSCTAERGSARSYSSNDALYFSFPSSLPSPGARPRACPPSDECRYICGAKTSREGGVRRFDLFLQPGRSRSGGMPGEGGRRPDAGGLGQSPMFLFRRQKPKVPSAHAIHHAHFFQSQSGGIRIDSCAPDGESIHAEKKGAWGGFGRMDFGDGGGDLWMAFAAAEKSGRRIEIRAAPP